MTTTDTWAQHIEEARREIAAANEQLLRWQRANTLPYESVCLHRALEALTRAASSLALALEAQREEGRQ